MNDENILTPRYDDGWLDGLYYPNIFDDLEGEQDMPRIQKEDRPLIGILLFLVVWFSLINALRKCTTR